MTAPVTPFLFRHSLVLATVTKGYERGCVKIRLSWMAAEEETGWIRVMAPAAGDKCGVFFMPEEHDQVLVAFSHGHIEHSYVLGVLWSKKSKPPHEDRAKRQLRSRSGHTITLDDTKDAELISIIDKSGKNKIVLDAKNNKITIECAGDLTIAAKGNLALTSKNVTINRDEVTLRTGEQPAIQCNSEGVALNGSKVNINKGALEVT
jgi:phage baseplate assembly protein V